MLITSKTTAISSRILNFIRVHGDHRITKESYAYYASGSGLSIVTRLYNERGKIRAVSLSGLVNGEIKYSITITHREHRNLGYGTKVLTEKIKIITEQYKLKYVALVASDNSPSLRVCVKSGLQKEGAITKSKASGEFTVEVLSKI